MDYIIRLSKLVGGLFLFALGTIITLSTNLGFSPWNVFHKGVSLIAGISIGTASITVAGIIVVIDIIYKEKIGLGTILDMFLVGMFMDLILYLNVIPVIDGLWGIPMIVLGLLITAYSTYLYMSSGFGAGPRDGLMVIITKKTKLPVGICRGGLELLAVVVGFVMGGPVGIGTIIYVLTISTFVQLVFTAMKFDVKAIEHEYFEDTIALIKKRIKV